MQTVRHIDHLIIGQGLAGTILAHHLIERGNKVLVINTTDHTCSSHIAAGLYSPVAGQRLALTWQEHAPYDYMQQYYKTLEQKLGASFFHPMPYIKVLINEKLMHYAQRKCAHPIAQTYLTTTTFNGPNEALPALTIAQSGYVDTTTMLTKAQEWLKQQDAYIESVFDQTALSITLEAISYQDIKAKQLIFCNGLQAAQNSFFPDIPFNPTKGEIITVRMEWQSNAIVSGRVFVLPLGNNLFHVGATFERDFAHAHPTAEGKAWLCAELEKLIDRPYEIINHVAGIRPTIFGHKPYIKVHEKYKNVAAFTGFGSKGLTVIPWCAKEFASLIA